MARASRRINNNVEWLVIFGAPFVYWLQSLAYSGPAFLADEIGYLSNAAFLAGHRLDAASSFHAGYSIFLAPLFALLSDAATVWRGVMLVNALLWVLAFLALSRLLSLLLPGMSGLARAGVLLVCALYPSWITMAGYALPSGALACVFLWSLLAMARWRPGASPITILPHSLCVGFLFWIHPTGLAAAIASVLVVGLVCWKARDLRAFGLHAGALVLMILAYDRGLHPWMVAAMTPPGRAPLIHYGFVAQALAAAPLGKTALRALLLLAGHASYLVVGTFGLAGLGALSCALQARRVFAGRGANYHQPAPAVAFLGIATTILVMLLGVASFAANPVRVDQWIYGRYTDPFSLLLLAVGFAAPLSVSPPRRVSRAAVASTLLVLVGVSIRAMMHPGAINVIQSTPAFWPQYLTPHSDPVLWMLMGAFALVVVSLAGHRLAVFALLCSFVLSGRAQYLFHSSVLARDARPSGLVDIVRANYPPGTCIGYHLVGVMDTSDFRSQRFQLYKFSFFNYDYRRMDPEEWLAGCNGPFLTLDPGRFDGDARVSIVAREDYSGLFLVVKVAPHETVIPASAISADDVFLARPDKQACLLAGCFSMTASELRAFSQVGRLQDDQLLTTGKSGALFYGPYYRLAAGRYFLVLRGTFTLVQGAALDVLSPAVEAPVFGPSPLCEYRPHGAAQIIIPFELVMEAPSLEVRLWVSEGDELGVRGYEIVSASEDARQPSKAAPCR